MTYSKFCEEVMSTFTFIELHHEVTLYNAETNKYYKLQSIRFETGKPVVSIAAINQDEEKDAANICKECTNKDCKHCYFMEVRKDPSKYFSD